MYPGLKYLVENGYTTRVQKEDPRHETVTYKVHGLTLVETPTTIHFVYSDRTVPLDLTARDIGYRLRELLGKP